MLDEREREKKRIEICRSWQITTPGYFFCGNFIGASAVNRQKCWNELYCWHDSVVFFPFQISLSSVRLSPPVSVGVLQILRIFDGWANRTREQSNQTTNRPTDQSQCNHKATNQIENLKLQRWKMCGFTMQMRKTLLLPNLYESFFNFYYAQCSLVGVAAVLSFISTFPLPVLATIIISFEFFAVATFFPFFHSFHIQCFLSLSLSHSLSLLVSVFRVRFYSCFPFVKSWKL